MERKNWKMLGWTAAAAFGAFCLFTLARGFYVGQVGTQQQLVAHVTDNFVALSVSFGAVGLAIVVGALWGAWSLGVKLLARSAATAAATLALALALALTAPTTATPTTASTPHWRGCTAAGPTAGLSTLLYPALAGMYRTEVIDA